MTCLYGAAALAAALLIFLASAAILAAGTLRDAARRLIGGTSR